MHTRSHLSLLRESIVLALILGIGAALVAFFLATQTPAAYKALISFDVIFINRTASTDQYGAYYDLKAAEIFSQNAMSWMMTPAVVGEVYTTAAIPYTIDSISRFTQRFETKQYGAQNFVVEFTEANSDKAYALASAVGAVMQDKARMTSGSDGTAAFALDASDPVVVKEHWNPTFVVVIAFLSGVAASLLLTYAREFFRSEHRVNVA